MSETTPGSAYQTIDPSQFGTPDDAITDVVHHAHLLDIGRRAIARHRSQRSPFEGISTPLADAFLADSYLIRVAENRESVNPG